MFSAAITLAMPLDAESSGAAITRGRMLLPCDRLHHVEGLYAKYGEDEASRLTWPWHLLLFVGSATVGSVIAIGFRHGVNGVVTGATGFALGELQLFTQPSRLASRVREGALGRLVFDAVPLAASTLDVGISFRASSVW